MRHREGGRCPSLVCLARLEKLSDRDIFEKKYGVDEKYGTLLFATGDGNHSLATAKAHWENLKTKISLKDQENHPARFALVEIVNIHDDGLAFEPIHRVVFNINPEKILDNLNSYLEEKGSEVEIFSCQSKDEIENKIKELENNAVHLIPFINFNSQGLIIVKKPKFNLPVGTLQDYLNQFSEKNPDIEIDYIHGEKIVDDIGKKEKNIGFYLSVIDKNDLFKTVILDGSLPRKTFSMGEAEEKRFYLESRKISF